MRPGRTGSVDARGAAGVDRLPRTIILGRESNLSAHLARAIPGSVLVSARELVADPTRLAAAARGERFSLIINAFRPSHLLREATDTQAYSTQALGATSIALDMCRRLEPERIAYTSSASVYGDCAIGREDDPLSPPDLHASLKVEGERLVQATATSMGIPSIIVRVFNMYAGDDRFSVVSKLMAAAASGEPFPVANDGVAVRDFIHISDVVRSYRALVEASAPPAVVNVATGRGVTVRRLLDIIAEQGRPVIEQPQKRHEIMRSVGSVERLGRFVDVAGFVRVEDHVRGKVTS